MQHSLKESKCTRYTLLRIIERDELRETNEIQLSSVSSGKEYREV